MGSTVKRVFVLGNPPWPTEDPFLFCVHHRDDYPEGMEDMGPDPALLLGRRMGMDFGGRDGWSMYHGRRVPGFPQHPHRGFETVTVARKGFIDHSDSLGATARYGQGDVQWMTAGNGIVHAEMFPLVNRDRGNPTELFQIWINLPARDKLVEPHFAMLWSETIPVHTVTDSEGRKTVVRTMAGAYDGVQPPTPTPNSWAADEANHVAIWSLRMEPGARFLLPATAPGVNRTLYFFRGRSLTVDGQRASEGQGLVLEPDVDAELVNGEAETEILMLQGKPIAEPVAHHGPFVMNTRVELQQAFNDYHRTRFGGWPWQGPGPVHARESGRFAIHIDGRREEPHKG